MVEDVRIRRPIKVGVLDYLPINNSGWLLSRPLSISVALDHSSSMDGVDAV